MTDVSKEEVEQFVMLMLRILTHPDMMADYIINPRGVLNDVKNNISGTVRDVVLSGNMDDIQKMFQDAGFAGEARQMVKVP